MTVARQGWLSSGGELRSELPEAGETTLSAFHTTQAELLPSFHFHERLELGRRDPAGQGEEQSEGGLGRGGGARLHLLLPPQQCWTKGTVPPSKGTAPPHTHTRSPHPLSSHRLSSAIFKAPAGSRITFFSLSPLSPRQEDTKAPLTLWIFSPETPKWAQLLL